MILGKFMELCNYHHHQFENISITKKRILHTHL
jgi:hypothetical protein